MKVLNSIKEKAVNKFYDKLMDRIEDKAAKMIENYIITFESTNGDFTIVGKKKA